MFLGIKAAWENIGIIKKQMSYMFSRSGFALKVLTLSGPTTLSGRRAHNLSGCEAADRLKTATKHAHAM